MRALAGVNFLVVDDNHHTRTIVSAILAAAGAEGIREAGDGQAAFEVVRDFGIDIAIVDFHMSPVDGVQFTKFIRTSPESSNPYLPIIMMTGDSAISRVHQARDAGVTEFVTKPLSPKSVLARVNSVIMKQRVFVRSNDYFGPDRRHKEKIGFNGPFRRISDSVTGSPDINTSLEI